MYRHSLKKGGIGNGTIHVMFYIEVYVASDDPHYAFNYRETLLFVYKANTDVSNPPNT